MNRRLYGSSDGDIRGPHLLINLSNKNLLIITRTDNAKLGTILDFYCGFLAVSHLFIPYPPGLESATSKL